MAKEVQFEDIELKESIYDEIVFLLKKDGLPLDYSSKEVQKSKMVREF